MVDNGSAGQEADRLGEEYGDRITLHRSQQNLGFTGGNNLVLSQLLASGGYENLILLNNDTVPAPDWLENLTAAAAEHPECGSVACHMVFLDNPDMTENTGIELLSTGDAIPRDRGQPVTLNRPAGPVAGACAGAALYRATALTEVGILRDEFFANFEDVDIAMRLQNAGWTCHFAPGARVAHRLNATIRKVRNDAFRIRSVRNQTFTYWINTPPLVIGCNLPALAITYCLVPLMAPMLGQWDLTRIVCRGRWQALRRLPWILRERRRLAETRRISTTAWLRMQRSFLATYARYLLEVVFRRNRRFME